MSSFSSPSTHRLLTYMPWLVLGVLGLATGLAWWVVDGEVSRTSQARFDRLAERVSDNVKRRVESAANLLHGAAALPLSSDSVTVGEWSTYLKNASTQLYSGVVGLGYVERVARGDVDALEARVRAQGEPNFTVERTEHNEWKFVVLAIEPRAQHPGVLGLDIGSGVTRRGAAEEAAARNAIVLSRRIRLAYEGRQVPGFLLLQPIYRAGADLSTPSLRVAAVQGWVYAPIRIDQLLMDVPEVSSRILDLDVFEGNEMERSALIYDSDGGVIRGEPHLLTMADYAHRAFVTKERLTIYGREWTIVMSSLPEFEATIFRRLPLGVLGGGIVVSILGAMLTWTLVRFRLNVLKRDEFLSSDLRQAQQESQRLALVASRTASGVILADNEWRVEWINDGFTRIFGFTIDELKGHTPREFLTGPDTDRKTVELMEQACEAGRPYIGEVLCYAKDGRKVWVEQEIQPMMNERGERTGFMGMQQDITERKRHAEQMREAKDAAEKANVAKGQFLAMMSHEIRTPMNGVIGMASLLLDSPLSPEQRESAETIRQSGESLLTIINDILDFSKIESGRFELDHVEFALNDCLEGALDLLSSAAAQKKIDLLYEISDGTPALVLGDSTRLRQVLVNLIGNAVKFTDRGEVLVSVKALAWHPSGVDLHFAVRDSGIGIPAESMERLFKPFSQVDASTTRRFGGTGLGLAICRRLVEMMGGRISVESEAGRGSTFSFTIRLQEIGVSDAIPASSRQSFQGKRLLIVDDNAASRRILKDLSIAWGLETVPVDSAVAALGLLRSSERFDAALIDLQMPDMNGQALARKIREQEPRARLPLVLLSGFGRRADGGDLFAAVVPKPVKPSILFDTLAEIFWRGRGSSEQATMVTDATPEQEPPHPGSILLAEDNPVNQKVTLHQLRSLGCRADVAANGVEVMAALERQPYDVVLLDLHMPIMDGLETARKICLSYPSEKRPWLIALTANIMPGDREIGLSAGMDDYLGKPIKVADLGAALTRARMRVHL